MMRRFIFLLSLSASPTFANIVNADHVQIRVIAPAEVDYTKPSQIGIHYKLDPEWHIYWKNPGDSGAAPKVSGIGIDINRLYWPYPKRIPVSGLTNYGYDEEAVLFVDLADGLQSPTLKLEWLVCKVDCIPGFATIPLTREHTYVDRDLFLKFKSRIPEQVYRLIKGHPQPIPPSFNAL